MQIAYLEKLLAKKDAAAGERLVLLEDIAAQQGGIRQAAAARVDRLSAELDALTKGLDTQLTGFRTTMQSASS